MNKIYIALILLLGLGACTKEDDLKPSGARDDYFTILSDTTPELKLRKEFYEKTGVHLLFNDTLRHEQEGTYADGSPYYVTELLDLGYSLSATDDLIRWTLLTDYEDQKKAAEIVFKYILPHMTGSMKPYSVWMLRELKKYAYFSSDPWQSAYYYNGMRSLALNYGEMASLSEDEIKKICQEEIFCDMIYSTIKDLDLSEFYSYCNKYYSYNFTDHGYSEFVEDTPEEEVKNFVYRLGFLSYEKRYNIWGTVFQRYIFTNKTKDLEDYIKCLLTLTDEEDWKKWEMYPVVYKKLEILKELVEGLGYKFKIEE